MFRNIETRAALRGAVLVAVGLAVGALVGSRDEPSGSAVMRPPGGGPTAGTGRGSTAPGMGRDTVRDPAELEQKVEQLSAQVAREAAERRILAQRLELIAAQLATSGAGTTQDTAPAEESATAPDATAPDGAATDEEPAGGASATERALVAAGVDAETAADITRRRDELVMAEMYLRDQAEREQWLDTPEFAREKAEIDSQRTPIRAEIGDDAYDRYLAALGQANRVAVDEVMLESPAAVAGLQVGDLVLRYGDTRIFAPGELVAETRRGTAGETVRLEVMRQGRRIEIEVPRGPLGLRIAATQSSPGGS